MYKCAYIVYVHGVDEHGACMAYVCVAAGGYVGGYAGVFVCVCARCVGICEGLDVRSLCVCVCLWVCVRVWAYAWVCVACVCVRIGLCA